GICSSQECRGTGACSPCRSPRCGELSGSLFPMRVHTLERSLTVHAPLDAVFPFFDRPENLERITPPWMRMQTITPEPVSMHVGSVIDYVVRVRGIPMRWTSIITEYDPPHRFVDVQLRGPYSLWHHLHTFRERK